MFNSDFSYYVQKGADCLFSFNDIEKIKYRIDSIFQSLTPDDKIKSGWKECTKTVIKYLKSNYFRLSDNILVIIRNKRGYSVSSICHNLKKDTGKTVNDWIQELKVKGAIELLNSTNFSIKMISNEVGYKSSQGFIKVFKKMTGKNPKEFRETK